jgi:hypothetical protein
MNNSFKKLKPSRVAIDFESALKYWKAASEFLFIKYKETETSFSPIYYYTLKWKGIEII